MKKETRGRKAKDYERASLRVPVELRAKFKREILEFELELEQAATDKSRDKLESDDE